MSSISVWRGIVSLSFLLNVACQLYYGLFATPSIKQVADAHHSAFSPNPYFITAFFIVQFIAQYFFVIGLFAVTTTPDEPTLSERFFRFVRLTPASSKSTLVTRTNQIYYSPALALGNLLHVVWTVLWMQEQFWSALPIITINTLLQFFAGVAFGPFDPRFNSEYDFPAHVISKLAAGVGCLGIIDTATTAAGYASPPSAAIQVLTVFLFVKLALIPELNGFWLCSILFDLLALCAGQPGWSSSLALAVVFTVVEVCMAILLIGVM
ncbi:hypothetical protein L210DRAFT_3550236 [Boletus edulis BED1]|uniref:Uncharacterized protein n=1 Tax=Boletus edulis BED1 TaxID=1328754 RepID=A0AAD4GC52_BOLED|nr:hypothetical protein L210DRAFT_3550236 [Boletus edulis BED1]